MMNSPNLNLSPLAESDLELLSAYLDNQLSVAERVSLERRLAAEPRLRAELEELRATTALLRSLEPVRPPRSFTLDPATAPRRVPSIWPFAWAMQLGSGLAGLALVLLATVQLLGGRPLPAAMPAPAPAAMATEAPITMMEAPAAQNYEAATDAPPAPLPTLAPGAEMRQDQSAAAPMVPAAEPTSEAAAASEIAPASPKEPTTDDGAGAAGGVVGGPTSNSAGAPPAAEPMIAPTIQGSDAAAADTAELPAQAAPAPPAAPQIGPWLTLAFGVALIALALGLQVARRRG